MAAQNVTPSPFDAPSKPTLVENTIPVLAIADVQASIRFYREVLGFALDWGGDSDTPHICSVSRNDHAIMLMHRTPTTPSWVWIGGDLLRPLWAMIKSRTDVQIIQRPTNQPWALEMKIQDPDGNILWFGCEPMNDVPFGQIVEMPVQGK